ncbi:PQQ-dependent sugar dehydrogenase [Coraliomargarita sp. SDUM461004]|uniref:PQQ-dependent sugar dehydrogenase n=1 Tax=Thalassobacterium sedimentorum TaxID=3041258 RepID=A0ABU1AKM0_9BACT|nr:PQQ-dependent sugar dehydrogenase [Coraliomargarita sp. SDUM461004]MDQ8195360.1 PQQ-dependent sugar dehydrogenase [Coraliomargarita sp. SDUM461004]
MRLFILLLTFTSSLLGQNRIGTGAVQKLYQENCMSCHGEHLDGGLGHSLLDRSEWTVVGDELDFIQYVQAGDSNTGMPGFREALTVPEIRSLEIYIDEVGQQARDVAGETSVKRQGDVLTAGGYDFRLEPVIEGLQTPWSIYFLSTTEALITERSGQLRLWRAGQLSEPITATPKVITQGQGGLLEVAAHPDYLDNGWIYLGFSAAAADAEGTKYSMTKIVRGRIVDEQWVDEQVIFEVPAEFHRQAGVHFGTRFVFQDGYLYFGIGDRGAQNQAQDLSRPNGKIHRIHDDGRVPVDNPFVNQASAYPSIWTFGNRNPQGLDAHPITGAIFESEHGPRGGDEINLILAGRNYGWPVITYGMNYNGKPITGQTAAPGMEQPLHYWTPSIAVCGIDFYEGDQFPEWKYNLFAGGLASQELHRLVIEDGRVIHDEVILKNEGRVRDVASGPDGCLYVVLNDPDVVARLVPAAE